MHLFANDYKNLLLLPFPNCIHQTKIQEPSKKETNGLLNAFRLWLIPIKRKKELNIGACYVLYTLLSIFLDASLLS